MNDDLKKFLSSIKIVLVNTTLPANIGSAARAMYTMGLQNLVVVEPKYPVDEQAMAHSAGAVHILKNLTIVANLQQAIQDCHWVFASSCRQRHLPKPVLTPRQAANLMLSYAKANEGFNHCQMAIVFGREDRGLTNDELMLADYHVQIPANPEYGVLNVAAAVQVIASTIFEQAYDDFLQCDDNQSMILQDQKKLTMMLRQDWDEPAMTFAQKQQLQTQILALLAQLDLYDENHPKTLPQRLSRLIGRLQLDVKEYQLLQSLCAKLLK